MEVVVEKKPRRVSWSSNADGADQLQDPLSSAEDQSSDQSATDAVGKTSELIPDALTGCRENDAAVDNVQEVLTSGSAKKKRHRRKRKAGDHHPGRTGGKWKPYDQLTWEERRKLDEKVMRRAVNRRDLLIASGQPMAPDNTNQFLMDQHDPEYAPFYSPRQRLGFRDEGGRVQAGENRGLSGSMSEDDDLAAEARAGDNGSLQFRNRAENEQIFLEKDFADAYDRCRAEHLQKMTKDQLLREYLEMEDRLEDIYTRLGDLPLPPGDRPENHINGAPRVAPDLVTLLKEEFLRLKEENSRLAAENTQLKTITQ